MLSKRSGEAKLWWKRLWRVFIGLLAVELAFQSLLQRFSHVFKYEV